jgi:hypothetical protein
LYPVTIIFPSGCKAIVFIEDELAVGVITIPLLPKVLSRVTCANTWLERKNVKARIKENNILI